MTKNDGIADQSAQYENMITSEKAAHYWEATGVSDYPPSSPVVGQSQFFHTFKHFIHLVDNEHDKFAHVFSIVAEWGRGKSRLGYELIAQINDESRGWFCRSEDGDLQSAVLFDGDIDRDKYLGLYIRYSQIATEFQNSENWFAYGVYKALLPLATELFDHSIQSNVAEQCFNRLLVDSFDSAKLAACLELDKNYSDQDLYDDEHLATRLVNNAYDYLKTFGIDYVLVVLDELETAAEAATFGLESNDLKRLDGRAIKLMGQAIKEEDPRRKLPWLRYVALCSPAIGEELREISSTARRFELVDLEHNAFADVSDYVESLKSSNRLSQQYDKGLIEAAYAMSGGNFGWFNVIMANIDQVLNNFRISQETDLTTGKVFTGLLKSSSRIRDHVLDDGAIKSIKTSDPNLLSAATELLFGQLPVALEQVDEATKQLSTLLNEYDEPVTTYYRKVQWDYSACRKALADAKFERVKGDYLWAISGVEQALDLRQLLANLATYAIHEEKDCYLIPLTLSEWVELVQLLYPHSVAEDAARGLWQFFYGDDEQLSDTATHIGPSVAMLNRLNLRYRRQSQNSLIFKNPDNSSAHESVMQNREEGIQQRHKERLTGLMRLLDANWEYDPVDSGSAADLVTIATQSSRIRGQVDGLSSCNALKLHPKGRLVLAYVNNEAELKKVCQWASSQFVSEGRFPVLAVTSSINLIDKFKHSADVTLQKAKDYLLLYRLNASEEYILEQVGLAKSDCKGFSLELSSFTSKFINRLNALERALSERFHQWRQGLNERGLIAWPLKGSQRLNDSQRLILQNGWADLLVRSQVKKLSYYDQTPHQVDLSELSALVASLGVPQQMRNEGYSEQEWSQLFSNNEPNFCEAQVPVFLSRVVATRLFKHKALTFEEAKRDWFWGYNWIVKSKDVFNEWMGLLQIALLVTEEASPLKQKESQWVFLNKEILNGHLGEANNWLSDEYPQLIDQIQDLFGEGRIRDLFAPVKSNKVGTKTNLAVTRLKNAQQSFQKIKQLEEMELPALIDRWEDYSSTLADDIFYRYEMKQSVDWVFQHESYQHALQSVQFANLDFEQDEKSLWERVAKAKVFADQVINVESKINGRVTEIIAEMSSDNDAKPPFPRNLFTLSLENVAHILSAAVNPEIDSGETVNLQSSEAGTLSFYLRNLDVNQATQRLDLLAKEVGYDTQSGQVESLDVIQGIIISEYRNLKSEFSKLVNQLAETKEAWHKLVVDLADAPEDFWKRYTDAQEKYQTVNKKINLAASLFDSVQDDADVLRGRLINDCRLGNFRGLQTQVPTLLDDARKQINQLVSHVMSLNNYCTGYYESLLQTNNIRYEFALNKLRMTKGLVVRPALTLHEIQNKGSLNEAIVYLKTREQDAKKEITLLLETEVISIERWTVIAEALKEGTDPDLSANEGDELVSHGVLVRTYRFAGE